jgi:hypothetical protein
MCHSRVLICRVDDPASDQLTELAAFDLPQTDLTTLKPETALDDLFRPLTPPATPFSNVLYKRNGM